MMFDLVELIIKTRLHREPCFPFFDDGEISLMEMA